MSSSWLHYKSDIYILVINLISLISLTFPMSVSCFVFALSVLLIVLCETHGAAKTIYLVLAAPWAKRTVISVMLYVMHV